MKFGLNVLKTMKLIAQNPEITAVGIASELNLNPRTIENHLAKLKEKNYIKDREARKTVDM
jgi:DNA-binding MarR family transcriptional regulator